MENCFGGNMIQNGKTVIPSLCTYWIVCFKKEGKKLKKKKEETPFHCHNAGLEAYNNLHILSSEITAKINTFLFMRTI
jgi:hypothetical protein